MDWLDYREKLGLGFSDEEKGKLFIVNMTNAFSYFNKNNQRPISEVSYFRFCSTTGTHLDTLVPYSRSAIDAVLRELKYHIGSFKEFLSYIVALINSLDSETGTLEKQELLDITKTTLNRSHIQFDILECDNSFYIFPKGVEAFDNALVSQVENWLKDYPKTQITWERALKDYSEAEEKDAGDVADQFRKALERFFQEFFGGEKNLENYKSEYGKYLKHNDIPAEIANNFEACLQLYTNFMNNYSSKHGSGAHLNVLEYIMYQTGNIIRLLITIKNSQ